ncbi:LON peptidase substrate-binding domain-containing protein [Mycobacterium sp.]|jgi:Lon protease-like protein|uniref:LON peptidase substrate-binding domain-containing protein n=1 Tax=Mycobacterium sp. TaxID=1785 RepID=UPI002C5645B3|nr:LON peptidase substrate-binding domain-containing protein [Mycobacterium sp.]HXB88609.1 LON peptidase substrate-binding domain-containing protein [Mycobacterium sp.]
MASAESAPMAMFPLQSALLPDEDLPMQIFEPRYTELVRDCMRDDDPRFGVVLISQGREVGGGDVRCDVGTVARITECVDLAGSGRFMLRCRTGERIRVCDWLPDDPYPRAMVQAWPDEPGQPVTADQLEQLEDRVMALFERIAAARSVLLPDRAVVLGSDADTVDPGLRLYALASRVPIGPADRYSVLAAPSAAERLAALSDAVDSVAAVIEFQLSE